MLWFTRVQEPSQHTVSGAHSLDKTIMGEARDTGDFYVAKTADVLEENVDMGERLAFVCLTGHCNRGA